MKRVAESQLTKERSEDSEDDSQELEVAPGLQKADPSVLGTRKIRSMPRRSLAPSNIPTVTSSAATSTPSSNGQPSESASRFSSFAGFGAKNASSNFTFSMSSPQQISITSSKSTEGAPALSSSDSTSPAFKPSLPILHPSNLTPPSTPPSAADSLQGQDAAFRYYLSLRGLNSSFLDAATTAIRRDPFIDISETLERYKTFRRTAQQEFDVHLATSASEATGATVPPVASQDLSKSPITPLPARNKQVISPSTGESSTPTASGFTPKVDPSSRTSTSLFLWPKTSDSKLTSDQPISGDFSVTNKAVLPTLEDQPTKPHLVFTNDKSSAKNDAFSFGFKPQSSAAPLTPGFASFMNPPKPSGEAKAVMNPGTSVVSPSSNFPQKVGSGQDNSISPFGTSPTFSFGSGKDNANPLGKPKAPPSSPFSPFGAPAKGSIGNPVGFEFGSFSGAPSTSDKDSASGAKTFADNETEENKHHTDETSSNLTNKEHDPSPAPSQGSAYDVDGPGEEEENTVHEIKAKAYRMNNAWTTVGTGLLKIKAHKELAKRRVLMRNSSTGQVILNFNLFPAFQVNVNKKEISFRVPGEDESAAVYRFRVVSESDALEWQKTLRREVENLVVTNDT